MWLAVAPAAGWLPHSRGAMGARCCCARQRRGEPQACGISWLPAARRACRHQGLAHLRRRRM